MSGSKIPKSPALSLLEIISGYRATQVIYVAAELRLADLLKDGPKSIGELANAVEADPRFLQPVLRALAKLGVFAEKTEGVFEITPLGVPLQTEGPDSLRATALLWGDPTSWRPWGELLYSVKTGKPSFEHIFGIHPFEYFNRIDGYDETFSEAMAGGADRLAAEILNGYSFSGMAKVVDVGGGHGSLVSAILQQYPSLRAVVLDRPSVVDGTRRNLEAKGLSDRCEVVGGSFFDSVPEGGDGYILCRTIHDWDDDRAATILSNCRRAMAKDAKLVVVEGMVRPVGEPTPETLSDVNIILMGGLERTESEFEALFDDTGFRLANVTPIELGLSIIEAVPV